MHNVRRITSANPYSVGDRILLGLILYRVVDYFAPDRTGVYGYVIEAL